MALEPIAASSAEEFDPLGGFNYVIHMPTRALVIHQGLAMRGNAAAAIEENGETYILQTGRADTNSGFTIIKGSSIIDQVGQDSKTDGTLLKYLKLREQFTTVGAFDLGLYQNVDNDSEGWVAEGGSSWAITGGVFNQSGLTASGWTYRSNKYPIERYRDEYTAMFFTAPSNTASLSVGLSLEGMTNASASATRGLHIEVTAAALRIMDGANIRATVAFVPAASTSYQLVAYRLSGTVLAEVYNSSGVLQANTSYGLSAPELVTYDGTQPWGFYIASTGTSTIDWIQWIPYGYPSGPRPLVEWAITAGDTGNKLWFKQALLQYIATVNTSLDGWAYSGLDMALSVEDAVPVADTEEFRGLNTGWTDTFPAALDWSNLAGYALAQTARIRFGHRGRRLTLTVHQGHPHNKDTRIWGVSVRARGQREGRP